MSPPLPHPPPMTTLPLPPPPGASWRGTGVDPARPDLPSTDAPRRHARWPLLALIPALVLLVGATASLAHVGGTGPAAAPPAPPGAGSAATSGSPSPSPSPSPTVPWSDPSYAFVHRSLLGGPLRWDPCRPISYALDLRHAPPYAASDTEAAFDTLAAATSLEFEHSTAPAVPLQESFRRMARRSHGGTDPGADIVLVWLAHSRYERLRPVYGLGRRSIAVTFWFQTRGAFGEMVGSVVVLDAGATAPGGFGDWWAHGPTVLHELGHAIGLDHVDDPGEIMYGGRRPDLRTTGLGPGDLEGLEQLGPAGSCG